MANTGVETITILRETGTAPRHGDRGSETEIQVERCTRIPRTSSETTDKGDTVIIGETLVCPGGTDLRATDRVRAGGDVYEIEGEPGHYRTRRNVEKAVIAALVRVTG